MSYAIVFSSKTGNTRLLADTLRASLPQNECTYFGAPAPEALEAETLYIGFWTDKGHADDCAPAVRKDAAAAQPCTQPRDADREF